MRIIAIALSDLHLHNWKAYSVDNHRLYLLERIFKKISNKAQKYKVPIFIPGDLFHNAKSLDNLLLHFFVSTFDTYITKPGLEVIAISGNHDMSEQNTITHSSPSYINTFSLLLPNLINLDGRILERKHFTISGIPYLNKNKGFTELLKKVTPAKTNKLRILMIHTDLPGAKSREFHISNTTDFGKDLDGFFKDFDLVLCGHIHLRQALTKKVLMLGTPYQQTWVESNFETGYYEIYENGSYKFKALDFMPKFKVYKDKSEINDFDFWAEQKKEEIQSEYETSNDFSPTTSRISLAKKYLRVTNIKDKEKRKALINILGKI